MRMALGTVEPLALIPYDSRDLWALLNALRPPALYSTPPSIDRRALAPIRDGVEFDHRTLYELVAEIDRHE